MSLSISDSDAASGQIWGRWLAVCLTILGSLTAALYLAVVLLDPYSTGRFSPIRSVVIVTDQACYADAARVRDLRFDSAIIGNSTILRVKPSNLSTATGRRFVSLALIGSWPSVQAVVAGAFARHHHAPSGLLVWGIDDRWCNTHLDTRLEEALLPRWLYESSDYEYLSRIFSPDSLNHAVRRALILLGFSKDYG